MKILIFIILLSFNCQAKDIRVAVIDTGYNVELGNAPICPRDNKSFAGDDLPLVDHHGHGTNVASLITDNSGARIKGHFCVIVLKFFDPLKSEGDHGLAFIQAISYATKLKVDIINISGGGTDFSQLEYLTIEKALNAGIKIVAAAGNEHSNLNDEPYYPASYDRRIYVIGSVNKNGNISSFSNYGPQVYHYEMGEKVLGGHYRQSGTSQATAIFTGKLLLDVYNAKNGLECVGR